MKNVAKNIGAIAAGTLVAGFGVVFTIFGGVYTINMISKRHCPKTEVSEEEVHEDGEN